MHTCDEKETKMLDKGLCRRKRARRRVILYAASPDYHSSTAKTKENHGEGGGVDS